MPSVTDEAPQRAIPAADKKAAAITEKSETAAATQTARLTEKVTAAETTASSNPLIATTEDSSAKASEPNTTPESKEATAPLATPETADSPTTTTDSIPHSAPFINEFDDPAIPLDVLEPPVREHQNLREWIQQREEERRLRRQQETSEARRGQVVDNSQETARRLSPLQPSSTVVPSVTAETEPSTPQSSPQAIPKAATSKSSTAESLAINPTTQTNPRDHSFDNIRAVLIFLVIFGHALEYFRLTDHVAEFIYVFIYFFHMPVFIFISGYFSKNLQRGRETAVRNFLLPYLLLNLLLSLIMLALGKIDEILILNPGWTLWYLYCMFIWRLLLPDLVKVRHILIASFVVAIFSGFLTEFGTYMAMARTLGFLPFFLAGYFCRPEHIARIRRFPYRRLLSLLIAAVGLLTASLWLAADLPPEILWGDRAYDLIGIPLWQNLLADIYLYALSFAFIFVFITLAKNRHRFYTIWGQNTLAIYLLHVYLVAPLVDIGDRIGAMNPPGGSWWGLPALQFFWLLAGSVTILWLLSRPIVSRGVAIALDRVTGWIIPKY
ncbi:acyltransferase family protein [Candidatus Enterococcus leclercqii]|uniref:acyltransferase family protein n=1 Tax=Candidatus Enterococcus leclercqii TaxID=1857218 RepID=UPI00137A5BBE|nr:acyltransferase family protein [Enterococcus sp. CU9D]